MNKVLWEARFREYLEMRNYSPRSMEAYLGELKAFLGFLEELHIESLLGITPDLVRSYRDRLFTATYRGKPISISTQAHRLCHLKSFLRFLSKEQFLPFDLSFTIELPRVPRTLPRVILSEHEAERVMLAADGLGPVSLRNRAILELLYGTAIRNQELTALTLDDLNLGKAQLAVRRGKGAKSRTLPLGQEAVAWLQEYLERGRPYQARSPQQKLLFLSHRGQALTRGTLAKMVSAQAAQAGLTKKVTPHVLRHSCATHMLGRGAGLRQLQELLGHDSIHSTNLYTHLEMTDLRMVLERCHPRENNSEGRP